MASACCAQRADRGARIVRARLGEKARHLLLEQQPRAARRHLALLAVLVDQLLQVVDGEEVNVVELGDGRLDVARHREIDHEYRTMAAGAHRGRRRALGDDRHRACRAAHDDVGLRELLVEARSGRPRSL